MKFAGFGCLMVAVVCSLGGADGIGVFPASAIIALLIAAVSSLVAGVLILLTLKKTL